ncbi:MAG: HyaD/HybD family hydrogenase maturation endopeptidase [Deltaproteobacteria bacterium]|jgi:hydrogenase maturation protease|nr:HyaD/HybD family hydrogenase maturation endopeptidase [Deltaproteobacteria bacterium]
MPAINNQDSKIGILGIGNLLMGDEGVGIHLLRYLEKNFILPPEVELHDGGTAGLMLASFVESCRILLVVDALDIAAPPGTIRVFHHEEVRAGQLPTSLSPHQLGFLETIELCRLRDRAPDQVVVIGICPARVEPGIELSAAIRQQLPSLAAAVGRQLAAFGLRLKPRGGDSHA